MGGQSKPAPNESCLCGSGKKWKKCHDPDSGIAAPEEPILFSIDQRIDPTLYALTMNSLHCLADVIASIKIDRKDRDRGMHQSCLAFYGIRLYRVSLAGVTLIRYDQGLEAFALKREQYYSWLGLHYYMDRRDEAVLFVASLPLLQKKKALEVRSFDEQVASDPKRRQQLARLTREAEEAYRHFPGLRKQKKKSEKQSKPTMVDWSEPSPMQMIRALAEGWIREEMEENNEVLADEEFRRRVDNRARQTNFYHSDFPSQEKHGTAFALKTVLQFDHDFSIRRPAISTDNPNSLLYIYLVNVIGAIKALADFNSLEPQYGERAKHSMEAFFKQKDRHDV